MAVRPVEQQKIKRYGAPVVRSQWATPDTPPDFFAPDQNAPMDIRESAVDKRALPTVSVDPTKESDPLAYSGAVPLPGAATPATPALTGLTSSGIAYDEGAYGPWHYYATEAGKKELAESRLPKSDLTYRRDVLGKMRRLPSGYMGIPDAWEKAKALERSRRG
jgi:hypothetical protein